MCVGIYIHTPHIFGIPLGVLGDGYVCMFMCAYMHVCIYIMCVSMYVCRHVSMYLCMREGVYTGTCVSMYISMYLWIHEGVYTGTLYMYSCRRSR